MAVTTHFFPSFGLAMGKKQVNAVTDTFQVLLITSGTYTWGANALADSTVSDFLAGSGSGALTEVSTLGTGYTRQTLAVTGLSDSNYSQGFEGGTVADWVADTNCSIANSTAQAHTGTHSLALTATAIGSGFMKAANSSGSIRANGMALSPGVTVTGSAWFRANTTAQTCNLQVDWYDVTGTLISTSTLGSVTDSSAAWSQASGTAVSPANTAYCRIAATPNVSAGAEVHYVDDVQFGFTSSNGFTTLTVSGNPTWSASTFTASYALFFDNTVGGTDATNQIACYWDFGGSQAITSAIPFVLALGSLNSVNQALVQWQS